MITPTYASGDWFAVITDGAVALLPPTIGPARLTLVWEALRESADLTHALTVLAKGGLAGLPPFALVSVVDGHARGFLRGNVRLLTSTASGTQEHSAINVATWAEINVSDILTVTVAVPSDVARGGRSVPLPALAAIVYASSVDVSLTDDPIVAARPADPTQVAEVTMRDESYVGGSTGVVDPTEKPVETIVEKPVEVRTPAPVHLGAEASAMWSAHAQAETRSSHGYAPVARRVLTTQEVPQSVDDSPLPEMAVGVPSPAPVVVDAVTTSVPAPMRLVPQEQTTVPLLAPQPLARPVLVPPSTEVSTSLDDDIFGSTVLSSSLVEIRRQMQSVDLPPAPGPFPIPPVPPAPPPIQVHRIRMSSGLIVPLDRVVLIGRAPAASRVSAHDLPRLVTVSSPNQDISRTHAQVHTDGEDVLVTDLNSTNGMLLSEPGQPPRRLRAGEPTPLSPDTRVDLGDGVTFTLERGR